MNDPTPSPATPAEIVHSSFPDLSEQAAALLLKGARVRRFARGEWLFSEGDACTSADWLAEGSAELLKSAAAGRDCILHIVDAGHFIDPCSLGREKNFFYSARALHDCTVLRLDRKALADAAALGGPFTARLLSILAMRQHMYINKIAASQGKISTRRRVSGWLLHKARMGGGPVVPDTVTRTMLAGLLGITRESLSRQLGRFAAGGLIRLDKGAIVLLDEPALRRELEE